MRAFNAADEEISGDIIINSRKDLINSLYDIEGEKAVLNNIVRSFETEEKEEEENRFDQNLNDINETIKKDNQQFLTKQKKQRQKKPFLKYQQHQHHYQQPIHLLIYFLFILFYKEIEQKRNQKEKMRLQVDLEFQ